MLGDFISFRTHLVHLSRTTLLGGYLVQHAELLSQLLIFFYHRMNQVILREEFSGCLSATTEVASDRTIQGGVHIFEFRESLAHPVHHAFHGLLIHQEGAGLNRIQGKGIVHLILLTVEVGGT